MDRCFLLDKCGSFPECADSDPAQQQVLLQLLVPHFLVTQWKWLGLLNYFGPGIFWFENAWATVFSGVQPDEFWRVFIPYVLGTR